MESVYTATYQGFETLSKFAINSQHPLTLLVMNDRYQAANFNDRMSILGRNRATSCCGNPFAKILTS